MDASSPSSSPSSSTWDVGKLFVGGITWNTESSALFEYFKRYGEVSEAVVVRNRENGNPRGFGFVLFSDPESAERALAEKGPHVILGRKVEVKRARCRQPDHGQLENSVLNKSGANSNGSCRSRIKSKKIFVGGLSHDVAQDDLRSYFEQFGKIIDVVVIYDNQTQRSRGFGFIEFELKESVENVMKENFHELKNKKAEVKIAVPKDEQNYRNNYSNYGRNCNSRMDVCEAYDFGNYQTGTYPTYCPGFGFYYPQPTVHGYHYGAPGYVGGYSIGGYDRIGYMHPYSSPQMNEQGLVTAGRNPMPYAQNVIYPGYLNGYANGGIGGYSGMTGDGYHGMLSGNDNWSQTGIDGQIDVVETVTSQVESLQV